MILLQPLLEYRLYLLQSAGVTPAHKDHVGVFVERLAEVGHQLNDAGLAGEFPTEG
jgi:hypothetical protein